MPSFEYHNSTLQPDMSENDAKGHELSEYPVIMFFEGKQGGKGEEYSAGWSMNQFKDFLVDKIPSLESVEL